MKVYEAASIRNVALVGHTGSGKTQLAAAILSTAGMVNRFGKVDEGTTVTDFDEEDARKHTLRPASRSDGQARSRHQIRRASAISERARAAHGAARAHRR